MTLSPEDRRALSIILALMVLASAARWLERPRPLLDDLESLDVAALEAASRQARPEPRAVLGAGERIDPNTASLQELQRLPGVGPATAQRIVEERERGPFRSVAELERVRGIGPSLSARLAEHVSLPPAATGPAGPPGAATHGSRHAAPAREPASTAASAGGIAPLDLNRATAAELQVIPGIGSVLAARLVARRDSLGGFREWTEVDAVSGVGPALLARLQERTRLGT
jgi:competence protein ComEA